MKKLELNQEERQLLEELERDEWISVVSEGEELEDYRTAAGNTLRKDKRVNIRISSRDLAWVQKLAAEEGIPYQTFLSSLIHKYVQKRLKM